MKKNIRAMSAVLLCLSVIFINGCGGGGGDSTGENNQQEEMMEVTLHWDAPTQYTDSTPIDPDDITGYTLYYGTESGYYTEAVSSETATCTLTLSKNTYYFVVTATVSDGSESDYSNEVSR